MDQPGFAGLFIMWAVMMTAMMAPAASPVILIFARARPTRSVARSPGPSLPFFIAGYLAVWVGFSIFAAGLQLVLHNEALLSSGMAIVDRRLAGAVLIGAGVFQFTRLKHTCLTQCRSPLGSLLGYWRDGQSGALLMGLRQGLFCLGCCWAEMLVLFVVGVMNMKWIIGLAVFVLLEKLSAFGLMVSRIGGVVAIVAGLATIFR